MYLNFFFEALVLLVTAVVVIRFAGKKTVARMTGLETVIFLAVGTTMGHAIKENKLWQVVLILIFFGFFLTAVQKLQLRFNKIERYVSGEATLVIHDGKINYKNLKKLRMTKGQLEMRLRQKGISHITDVKVGTVESDGEVGYELMPHAKPVTMEDLLKILNKQQPGMVPQSKGKNIFDLVVENNK